MPRRNIPEPPGPVAGLCFPGPRFPDVRMKLQPLMPAIAALALLGACGETPPAPAPIAETPAAESDADRVDWSRCRIPDVGLPVPGRLFVVDGGPPPPDAEPGRESIRRVDVRVPGPVALLLTAPDATAWHVRVSPETQLRAIFASGVDSQRITGQGLGRALLTQSGSFGEPCGRYWLEGGAGPALAEVSQEVFGRPHDAIYRMRIGSVIIGGTDPGLDQPVDRGD